MTTWPFDDNLVVASDMSNASVLTRKISSREWRGKALPQVSSITGAAHMRGPQSVAVDTLRNTLRTKPGSAERRITLHTVEVVGSSPTAPTSLGRRPGHPLRITPNANS